MPRQDAQTRCRQSSHLLQDRKSSAYFGPGTRTYAFNDRPAAAPEEALRPCGVHALEFCIGGRSLTCSESYQSRSREHVLPVFSWSVPELSPQKFVSDQWSTDASDTADGSQRLGGSCNLLLL
jgi:hypothetical protein